MRLNERKRSELKDLEEELLSEDEDIFEKLEGSRKSWKRGTKIIIFELVILAFLATAIAVVGYWRNNPERIAKEYVHGAEKGEWNEIYDNLYFSEPDNPFLSKKMFVTAKGLEFDDRSILHVKIIRAAEIENGGQSEKMIEVSYTKNDKNLTKAVPMLRKNGIWYVDGDKEFVKEHMKLKVTKGAAASLDGIMLDESVKKSSDEICDFYELPKVFDGLHYLVLEKEYMEKYEDLIRYGEEPVEILMKYNGEMLEKAGKQAQEDIIKGYKKAAQSSESGRELIKLKLTQNYITVKHSEENPKWLEVTVDSHYEYRFIGGENDFYRRKTEKGRCSNVCVYECEEGELKLKKQKLNELFL